MKKQSTLLDADPPEAQRLLLYIYPLETFDFENPSQNIMIGDANSVVMPICRLVQTKLGLYAALLPRVDATDIAAGEARTKKDVKRGPQTIPRAQQEETSDKGNQPATYTLAAVQQVQDILQKFLRRRGATVTVNIADATEVLEMATNSEALELKLHTLLQAGLQYADSGIVAARRLVDQWRSFYTCCAQGAGQPLGKRGTPETRKENAEEISTNMFVNSTHSPEQTSAKKIRKKKALEKTSDRKPAANKHAQKTRTKLACNRNPKPEDQKN